MAVIINETATTLSTASGFYRVEAHNLGSVGSVLSLSATMRSIPFTPANAGNCRGVVLNFSTSLATLTRNVNVFLCETKSTCTLDLSTDYVTNTGHGLSDGAIVTFATTGALPTGLSIAAHYYVINSTTNTFQVALTAGGAAINLSGTQSGTHTLWVVRASKTHTPAEIIISTNKQVGGVIMPFIFDTPYAIDTTASKWKIAVYQGTGTNDWNLATSDNTNAFYAVWCDTAATFSSGNDCVICGAKVTVDMTAVLKPVAITGSSVWGICGIACRSADATPENVCLFEWDSTPAASYELTLDGMFLISANGGVRVGTSTNRIPYAQQAIIKILRAPSVGSAGNSGFSNARLSTSASARKGNFFFYGEIPTYRYTTLASDVASGSGSLTTTDATGWAVNDQVYVSKRDTTSSVDQVLKTISAISGTSITCTALATTGAKAGASVVLVGKYGIYIYQDSGTSQTSFLPSILTNFVMSGVHSRYYRWNFDSSSTTSLDDSANRIENTINNCLFESDNGNASGGVQNFGWSESGLSVNDNIFCRSSLNGLYPGLSPSNGKAGPCSIYNNRFLWCGSTTNFATSTYELAFYNNIFEHNIASGASLALGNTVDITCYGNYFWGNGSPTGTLTVGTTILSSPLKRIYENHINKCTMGLWFTTVAQNKAIIEDTYFADEAANTSDIGFAPGAFVDTTLVNPTGISTISLTNQNELIDGGVLSVTKYNGTDGDDRSWRTYGRFASNSGKIDFFPSTTTTALVNEYNVSTGAISGNKIAVSLNAQIASADYYAGTHTLPTLAVVYDGSSTSTDVGTATTASQVLYAALTPTTDNSSIIIRQTIKSDAATEATRAVTFDSLRIVMRRFGKLQYDVTKAITKTTKELFSDLIPLTTDSTITETTEATVAGYDGITITHGATDTIVLDGTGATPVNTSAMLYDYCQYNLALEANLAESAFYYTVDGGLSFTSAYDMTIDGVTVTATDKTLRMGANTLTLANDGVWTGVIDGAITISDAGTYPINIGSEAVTFAGVGTYDLSGGSITGTIELINTSGGAVTVTLAAGTSYTNTGPNITVDVPPVAIAVSNIVAGSRLYIYDTVTATELYNDIPGTSHSLEISTTGNLTTVKIRKAGYKTFETSVTPGAAGASVTANQEADTSYNASYNAGMATDWSVNTGTKKLARGTTNINSVRDFHSYWNALFAGATYMEFDVPTSAFTKYEVQLENGYTFDAATDHQKLRTGSIYDPVADDLWGNIISIGNATTETVYLVQNDSEVTNYWAAGNIDILLKVKESGTAIDSGIVHIYCRDFNRVFDHTSLTITEGGKNYASLAVGADPNNETLEATVAGYSDITLDETGVTVDISAVAIDAEDTPADYTLGVDCAGRTVQQVFEYLKYAARHNSAITLNGDAGEEHYRYSTYPELKNGPLGQLIGGIFYGAQGVWLTNVASADALNYVLTDNAGTTHQTSTPPVAIEVTNIVAGSRIQVYDITNSTELANEIVAGTSYSLEKSYVADLDIRIRLAFVNGVTAKAWYETQGSFTSAGMNLRASQTDDTVYNYIGIDGSTVTECTITGTTLIVAIDDADNATTWSRIYAFEAYWLFTEGGMRDQELFIAATDAAHYVFEGGLQVKNMDAVNPLVISGGFAVDDEGSASALLDLSGGMIFTASTEVVPFAYGAETVNVWNEPPTAAENAAAVEDALIPLL